MSAILRANKPSRTRVEQAAAGSRLVLFTASIVATVMTVLTFLDVPADLSTTNRGFEQGVFRIRSDDNGLRCNPFTVNTLEECHGVPVSVTGCHSGPLAASQKRVTFWPPERYCLSSVGPRMRRARRRRVDGKRACIYARHSSRFQHSVADQVRQCREWCEKNGLEVNEDLIFVDEATTGKRASRAGLDRMKQAIRDDEVDVVVCLATSRLYRRALTALQFAQDYIVEENVRCVFILQTIDSLKADQWQLLLHMHAMMDETQLKSMVGHIQAGHEGLLLMERVHSTLAFGYSGVEIEGAQTRQRKPSRRIEIDENLRPWVIQAFRWFVEDKLNYKAIARRLSASKIAPPPKVDHWTWLAVKYLLGNRRYTGDWSYGRRGTVWINRLDSSRQIPRDKPLREYQIERLRIIDDALFAAAQERLESLKLGEKTGRWRPDAKGEPLIDLLHGLLWCPVHDRPLVLGGTRGNYWICRACKKADTPCQQNLYSQLPRDVALKMVVEKVVEVLQIDDATTQRIVDQATLQVEDILTRPAEDVSHLDHQIANLAAKIKFMFDNLGDTEADRQQTQVLLSATRRQKQELESRMRALENSKVSPPTMPSAERIRTEAVRRSELLLSAQDSNVAETRRKGNEVLRQLVGTIFLEQVGDRAARRGHLRGTLRPKLLALVDGLPVVPDETSEPVTIDFVAATKLDADAQVVGMMLNQHPKMTLTQIGDELKLSKSAVTKAVKAIFGARGEPVPNMRRRGQQLKNATTPPPYIAMAERAGEMYLAGRLLAEIADAFGSNRTTVEKSLRYYCQRRGIEYVDGRTRRKQLAVKSRPDVS